MYETDFYALISIFLFLECNEVQKDSVRTFIEGSYVSAYATAYTLAVQIICVITLLY